MNVVTETSAKASDSPRPAKSRSERTCAGCGRTGAPEDFVRVVLGPRVGDANAVAVDLKGGGAGRGAHIHPAAECIHKACKSGLSRTFRCTVHAKAEDILGDIAAACQRRIEGLLSGAKRGGLVAICADATIEAIDGGQAALVVVACDAGTVTSKGSIGRAIAEGRALAWSNKDALGGILGREKDVSLVAVKSDGVAREIRAAFARSEACRSSEGAR